MKVVCIDCGIKLNDKNKTERPRIARKDGKGFNFTIDCCKNCLDNWLQKHPEYKLKVPRKRTPLP